MLKYKILCSYKFMLNETPNDKDVARIEDMVLNEGYNSSDATRVANNIHLTTMGTQFSTAAIYPASCRKVDLLKMRDNDAKTIKVYEDRNKLHPGKKWRLYAQ